MNNDLEQFSEERLKVLTEPGGIAWSKSVVSDLAALARIALAAKQAKPVAWLLSGGGATNIVSFDSGNAHADPLRDVTPLYTTPPANSPEIPDGWIKCSERMPDDGQIVVIINAGHGEIYEAATVTRHGPHFLLLDGLEASNYDGGAVVTLGLEATHWMPLPPPPVAALKPESD